MQHEDSTNLIAKLSGELDAMKRLFAVLIETAPNIGAIRSAWSEAMPGWLEHPPLEQLFVDIPAYREAHLRALGQLSLAMERTANPRGA